MRYLLVEVSDLVAEQFLDDMTGYPGVADVTEHGPGCCCKNCPWQGDHGWHEETKEMN